MEAPCSYHSLLELTGSQRALPTPQRCLAFSGVIEGAFLGRGGTHAGVGCAAGASRGRAAAQRYLLVLWGDVTLELHKRRKSRGFYAQPDDISSIQ